MTVSGTPNRQPPTRGLRGRAATVARNPARLAAMNRLATRRIAAVGGAG